MTLFTHKSWTPMPLKQGKVGRNWFALPLPCACGEWRKAQIKDLDDMVTVYQCSHGWFADSPSLVKPDAA